MSSDVHIGIIGGSGLGDVLAGAMNDGAPSNVVEVDTPFGAPSGPITTGTLGDVPVALLQRHGDGHVIPPAKVPYRANIFALKTIGCTHVVASGATGSLREEITPGDVVICDQLLDRTDGRPRTFFEKAAVHVEFADPFCPVTRKWLLDAAASLDDVTVHTSGTYVCMQGPSFSTKAESRMHRQLGADVVGMTALPEARLAREAELAYALIALPTDYDCWRPRPEGADEGSLLEEIIGNLRHATETSVRVLKAALGDMSALVERSPAHDALRLGIWSDKSKVERREVERLDVLWGRYFEA